MPLTVLPMFLVGLLQTKVAIQRIEDFLGEDEVPTYVSSLKLAAEPTEASDAATDDKIGFSGSASFRWNSGKEGDTAAPPAVAASEDSAPKPSADDAAAAAETANEDIRFELDGLDFLFPDGLTIISGPTGSGKTALLYALLGEMETVRGKVHLPKRAGRFDAHGLSDSVAYAGQAAWLQNMSIRDNILFNTPFDQSRYDEVIKACCLTPDLQMLEDGDSQSSPQPPLEPPECSSDPPIPCRHRNWRQGRLSERRAEGPGRSRTRHLQLCQERVA